MLVGVEGVVGVLESRALENPSVFCGVRRGLANERTVFPGPVGSGLDSPVLVQCCCKKKGLIVKQGGSELVMSLAIVQVEMQPEPLIYSSWRRGSLDNDLQVNNQSEPVIWVT